MRDHITFETYYPHSPERVWQALTDPRQLGRWLAPTDFTPTVGACFHIDDRIDCQILELEAAARLVYTWDDGEAGMASVVSWSLEPRDGGTLLKLEHRQIEASSHGLLEAEANWPNALTTLSVLLRNPVPVVYLADEKEPDRRAGFRQEEELVCR